MSAITSGIQSSHFLPLPHSNKQKTRVQLSQACSFSDTVNLQSAASGQLSAMLVQF